MTTKKTDKIRIQSDIRNLAEVRRFIEKLTKAMDFTDEQVFDIKVATGEAVSNAIEHGSPRGVESVVIIEADYNKDIIEIKITDEGVFKPSVPVDNPSFHHRGRGISFMLALMDQVNISESENGTTVSLVKKAK